MKLLQNLSFPVQQESLDILASNPSISAWLFVASKVHLAYANFYRTRHSGSWNFQVSLRLLRCASCGLLRVLPRSNLDPGDKSDPREACETRRNWGIQSFLRTVLEILICHIWEICIPTHEKSIFVWICFELKPLLKNSWLAFIL